MTKLKTIKFLTLSIIFISEISKAQSLYFPPIGNNSWDTISPSRLGWCNEKIDSLMNFLEKKNTKAFLILKDGKIVIEKYFGTFKQDSIWYWASAGKTLTAFATGIAKQEGYIKLNDTSSKYLGNNWTSCNIADENKITVWHQLTMTTGLDDGVADPYCTLPSCMKYKANAGSRWAYHNAPYTMLDKVIESATGKNLNLYLYQKLILPIGMSGLFVKSGYNNIFMSNARTMARFGLLILNKGNWNGNKIMTDTTYYREMTNTSQNLNLSYGYLWWLNGKKSFMVPGLQYAFNFYLLPSAPSDLIAALGKNGQFINVVPSQNLVLIRMGNAPGSKEVPIEFNDSIWQRINTLKCNLTINNLNYQNEIKISPNPFSSKIAIENLPKNVKIKIVSYEGKTLFEGKDLNNFSLEILNEGLYFFEFQNLDTFKTSYFKVIKK
ncbi:MAG: serine hydrolase [Bacteroidia bacterium]|nr:serine hydrolase [Bacteroidia bacterium]